MTLSAFGFEALWELRGRIEVIKLRRPFWIFSLGFIHLETFPSTPLHTLTISVVSYTFFSIHPTSACEGVREVIKNPPQNPQSIVHAPNFGSRMHSNPKPGGPLAMTPGYILKTLGEFVICAVSRPPFMNALLAVSQRGRRPGRSDSHNYAN